MQNLKCQWWPCLTDQFLVFLPVTRPNCLIQYRFFFSAAVDSARTSSLSKFYVSLCSFHPTCLLTHHLLPAAPSRTAPLLHTLFAHRLCYLISFSNIFASQYPSVICQIVVFWSSMLRIPSSVCLFACKFDFEPCVKILYIGFILKLWICELLKAISKVAVLNLCQPSAHNSAVESLLIFDTWMILISPFKGIICGKLHVHMCKTATALVFYECCQISVNHDACWYFEHWK